MNKPAMSSTIDVVIEPKVSDLGGFSVRRALPHGRHRAVGPWVFFDHMGPVTFPAGSGIDVRPHPHINLATVTYLFEGEIVHRDSLGCVQTIRPGEINLMVAGRGIVHSERTGPELRAAGHALHGLQLWLALPDDAEETEPAFLHYGAEVLPASRVEGVPVRVMIGSAYGVESPVRQHSPTLYLEAELARGQSLRLPDAVGERGLYLASGRLRIDATEVAPCTLTVLNDTAKVAVEALEDSRIALVGGEPLGERHIWWNFVSSRRERIEQAKADWREGRFATVPGETEFIPLP
jgi:redox-sensitive bicupin YhaK (pirin superfamily)